MEHARRAQRTLDGVPSARAGEPIGTPGPLRDITISPSSLDAAKAQIEQLNRERTNAGQGPIAVDVSRQTKPMNSDPIMAWETATVRISGATQEELEALRLNNVGTDAEKRVKTDAVLQAACAATRVAGNGNYISRKDGGEQSTPALASQYVADGPDGPTRTHLAPTPQDQSTALAVRTWARLTQPTNDYARAVRHSVSEEYMSLRDVGTAASAVAGYQRHEAEFVESERRRRAASEAGEGAGLRTSPGRQFGQPSRWLNQPGDKVMVVANVERVVPVQHEARRDPHLLYIMRTPDGDAVKWMASETWGLREGDTVTLRGQVKAHSTFNGEKQTEMYYCKPQLHE